MYFVVVVAVLFFIFVCLKTRKCRNVEMRKCGKSLWQFCVEFAYNTCSLVVIVAVAIFWFHIFAMRQPVSEPTGQSTRQTGKVGCAKWWSGVCGINAKTGSRVLATTTTVWKCCRHVACGMRVSSIVCFFLLYSMICFLCARLLLLLLLLLLSM